MVHYSDVHIAFLQAFANRGSLTITQATEILSDSIDKYGDEPHNGNVTREIVLKYIKEINHKLEMVEQKLMPIEVETDVPEKEFIVFTNTTHSAAFKYLSQFSEIEVNYFKVILREIATSGCFYLPIIHILNLCTSIRSGVTTKKITQQRAEELIRNWCDTGYFLELNDDMMHFGPRTIGEFSDYLRTKYTDSVSVCSLCNRLTFQGIRCANETKGTACTGIFHQACLDKYLEKKQKCVKCKKDWIGEEA